MTRRILAFANSAVSLAWSGNAAGELIDFLFGSVPARGEAVPHIGFHLATAGEAGPFVLRIGFPGEEQQGAVLCQAEAGAAAVMLMERVCFHLAERSTGGLLLHAAGVGTSRQTAWLLPGASGAGKSTLAVWLAQQGLRLITDELVYIAPPSYTCTGFSRPIYLKESGVPLFSGLPFAGTLPVLAGAGGILIPPAAFYPDVSETLPLQGLLFPAFQPGADFHLERLTQSQTALALAQGVINARNLAEHGFPAVLALAQAAPAFRVTYSRFDQWGDLPQRLAGGTVF